MSRPTIAILTGFTKSPDLPDLCLAPLQSLKEKGVIDRILAVTWDKPEIDEYVEPLEHADGVELIRVPEPNARGERLQKGVIYQIRNLEAALREVPEGDALILKLRPDFIADEKFLEDKIVNFDRYCAPSDLGKRFGVDMPPSPFKAKIWLPWADANQPFFYEDGAFMGLKRDIQKLANREVEKKLEFLVDKNVGWYAHVVRFMQPFLASYPIFLPYARNFQYFPNNLDYRLTLVPGMTSDAFYWHLLVAHAWILVTNFHVDCGAQGQLAFYPNISNENANWRSMKSLEVNSPYDCVEEWRAGQKPGGLMPCAARAYGRLMDDSWQHALFTQPTLRDLGSDKLRAMLRNVMLYKKGLLNAAEADFARKLAEIYEQNKSLLAA